MMRNVCMGKVLVVGIIVLFIGVSVQPSMGTEIPEKIEVEPKDYLFQTIIDISNNPDVKDLLEQTGDIDEVFNCDYNFRNNYRKLLFKNPRMLLSMLFTKPSITLGYLDSIYDKGCELVNIIGESKTIEIVSSIEVNNPEFFNELNHIIMNDEELYDRISILREMNEEIKLEPPFQYMPILCYIIIAITILGASFIPLVFGTASVIAIFISIFSPELALFIMNTLVAIMDSIAYTMWMLLQTFC